VLCLSIRLSNDQARTLTASPKPRPILHEVAPPAPVKIMAHVHDAEIER
jgi:hypothetical protein